MCVCVWYDYSSLVWSNLVCSTFYIYTVLSSDARGCRGGGEEGVAGSLWPPVPATLPVHAWGPLCDAPPLPLPPAPLLGCRAPRECGGVVPQPPWVRLLAVWHRRGHAGDQSKVPGTAVSLCFFQCCFQCCRPAWWWVSLVLASWVPLMVLYF